MPEMTLLVIDDDALDRKAIAVALKAWGIDHELHEAGDSHDGMKRAAAEKFDCILVDYNLPDKNGLELLVELREGLKVTTPIVMLTGSGSEGVAVEAMKRGASDYLPKDHLGPESLFRAVSNAIEKRSLQKKLEEIQRKLERLALYDELTGLGNANLFHLELARTIAVSHRKKTSFVLLMMDLDKFKAANDTFGHEAGDAILAEVGRRLRLSARASDAYFRLGGDEFTAILDAGSDGRAVAGRVMVAIAEPISFGPHVLEIEVSVGLATYPADAENAPDLIRVADTAMYDAKKSEPGATWPRRAVGG